MKTNHINQHPNQIGIYPRDLTHHRKCCECSFFLSPSPCFAGSGLTSRPASFENIHGLQIWGRWGAEVRRVAINLLALLF